jgi:hypothetical protein
LINKKSFKEKQKITTAAAVRVRRKKIQAVVTDTEDRVQNHGMWEGVHTCTRKII